MTSPIIIDKAQARRFLLGHHRLLPPRRLSGKQGILDYIRHVNCVQFDPINVVGQNPHLVLQSRVRDFRPQMLNDLLYEDRKLIEGFDKQMSIYPVEDWPLFAYYREQMAKKYMESNYTAAAAKLVKSVREQIAVNGPISSLELEGESRMDWWLTDSVRAVRIALDILLYGGEIVVHHRVGSRRYFDLAERELPSELIEAAAPHASHDDYMDWHVFRRARGLGLANLKVTAAYGGTIGWQGGRIKAAILRLAEKGWLLPVTIEELPRQKLFVRRDDLPALEAAAKSYRGKLTAALIAPLDPLMWSGDMVNLLFDFQYTWEVYKPADKRVYGYYVLPVLYGERFMGRVDPEFDRSTKVLTIKNWWWEDGVDKKDEAMQAAIGDCLPAFAKYLEAKEIRLGPALKRDPVLTKAIKL